MAMNDEETVALIAGGHTFGSRPTAPAMPRWSVPSRNQPIEEQGLGWKSKYGSGVGGDAIGSGLEVIWTSHAHQVEQQLLLGTSSATIGSSPRNH